jgi:hypothetical protein
VPELRATARQPRLHRFVVSVTRFHTFPVLASQWARSSRNMKAITPKSKWFGFLNIPEGRSGNAMIQHRRYATGTVLRTASARTMIFAGHACVEVAIPTPDTVVHELRETNGTVWMTDLPIEQAQIDRDLVGMNGRVLVGGLGLGYAAQRLALRRDVESVWVIEKSADVIALVEPHLRGHHDKRRRKSKIRVVHADLHEWLAEKPDCEFRRFDWAFYDIWAPDGERTFFRDVLPLRRKTGEQCHPERVRCWNEDVMRGQLYVGMVSKIQMLQHPEVFKDIGLNQDALCELAPKGMHADSHNFAVPFFRAIRDGRIPLADAHHVVKTYVTNFGIEGRLMPC